jgi:hypothetical protein
MAKSIIAYDKDLPEIPGRCFLVAWEWVRLSSPGVSDSGRDACPQTQAPTRLRASTYVSGSSNFCREREPRAGTPSRMAEQPGSPAFRPHPARIRSLGTK